MGIQPGSKNSPLRIPTPASAPKAAPSPGLQKLTKEAQKLPGQVKAMSAAIKSAQKPAAPGKPAAKPK
jgi:hypothetical protein